MLFFGKVYSYKMVFFIFHNTVPVNGENYWRL